MHRRWEDWLGAGLGLLVGVTPWLAGETSDENLVLHTAQLGMLILGLSVFGLVQPSRWEEIGQLACGLWLAASPAMLAYADAGNLADWHLALGLVVMVLALLEIWQDWQLTSKEMAGAWHRGNSGRR